MKVTKEMIGAAHDVMLAKGDIILSAALLERVYIAMSQAAPTQKNNQMGGLVEACKLLVLYHETADGASMDTYFKAVKAARAALAAWEPTK